MRATRASVKVFVVALSVKAEAQTKADIVRIEAGAVIEAEPAHSVGGKDRQRTSELVGATNFDFLELALIEIIRAAIAAYHVQGRHYRVVHAGTEDQAGIGYTLAAIRAADPNARAVFAHRDVRHQRVVEQRVTKAAGNVLLTESHRNILRRASRRQLGIIDTDAVEAAVDEKQIAEAHAKPHATADIGGGMRLRMGFGDLFFIDGGFNSVSVDNPELSSGGSAQDVSVRFREQHIAGGLRYALFDDALVPYITVGEYRPRIRVSGPDSSERISDSSLIFGAGVHYTIMTALHVVGSYRRADDLDQGEFEEIEVGGAYQFARSLAIFAPYRMGGLSFDNGTGFDSDDIRLGLRFSFDTEGDDENFY